MEEKGQKHKREKVVIKQYNQFGVSIQKFDLPLCFVSSSRFIREDGDASPTSRLIPVYMSLIVGPRCPRKRNLENLQMLINNALCP